MSAFTSAELTFLASQLLGRIATVGPNGHPHVVPVGFRYDAASDGLQIGGHGFGKSKKWRDLEHNPHVAFVVDDLVTIDPWVPRGIEVRGTAVLHPHGGGAIEDGFSDAWIGIVVERIVAWGLDDHFMAAPNARSVGTESGSEREG